MKRLRFISTTVLTVCLFAHAARSNVAEEPTKEQRIAEFAKMPVAERQKPGFFTMKLVAKDSAERVAAEHDRSKIKLAEDEEILVLNETKNGKRTRELLIVNKSSRINRTHISECSVVFGQNGVELSIKFTEVGGRLFGDVTTDAVGQRLAIIVGGSFVLSAPHINEPILFGSAVISAKDFTEKDAASIASLFVEPESVKAK